MNLYIRILLFFSCICVLRCQNSVLSGIEDETTGKIQSAFVVKLGPHSASFLWKCSRSSKGYLLGPTGIIPSLKPSETHAMEIQGLSPQTNYDAFVTCGTPDPSSGIPLKFRTWVSDTPEKTQGIWLIGGIGTDQNPVMQIDLFDASSGIWYPAITSVPTPRAFASILSHKQKIYVIGGLVKSGGVYSTSLKVEVYDPYLDTWTAKSDLPQAVQGAVSGSVGDEIYIVSGSGSTNISSSPLLNTVLKFYPELGTSGQWLSYSSNATIFPRTDMSGCAIDGVLFYSGGRLASNGFIQSGTDGYIPGGNTTTGGTSEPSINVQRSGAAGVCVNPEPKDLFPSDNQWFGVIGGSIATDTNQPIVSLTASNKTDFYQPGSVSFSAGPDLPQSIYYPGAQASYETRKIYVFGGASSLNVPLDTVYSIDSANPVASAWSASSMTMPRARFGHQAIRIDR
ncbi:Kelch repeat-containing protein [Leptospira wolffii]|uniref:Kelch repeat-containing protein n=1 Tax=Leptospira wolffii TaxID=409998 RepID=UPI0002D5CF5E|nr:kelch repeat protein [Leptospira wolffii]EPG67864.1 kelch repeat protein [Leptospira wolffii serovar Khorat str. Khorat-H2]